MPNTEDEKVIRRGDPEMDTLNTIHAALMGMFRDKGVDPGFALNITLAAAVTLVRELERVGYKRPAVLRDAMKFLNENLAQWDAEEARAKRGMQ